MSCQSHEIPIMRAVDLTWDRKDRGGPWLVVERGFQCAPNQTLSLTGTGRLVATSISPRGACNVAGKARAALRRHGLLGRVDVVSRESVEIITSGQPYGC